jgi:hypothetical protein
MPRGVTSRMQLKKCKRRTWICATIRANPFRTKSPFASLRRGDIPMLWDARNGCRCVRIAKGDGHESSGVKSIEVQRKREKSSSTKNARIMSSREDIERLRNDKYQMSVRRVEATANEPTRLTKTSQ